MDTAVRGNSEQARLLADLKANRQGEYKARVRAARIDPTARGAGTVDLGHRRSVIADLLSSVEQSVTVETDVTVLWPDHREYVSYMVSHKGITVTEAEACWTKDLQNPVIQKRGVGEGLRVAVQGIPITTARSARTVKRAIVTTSAIEHESDLDIANKRLCHSGIAVNPSDSAFEEVGGAALRIGAVSLGPSAYAAASTGLAIEPPPTAQRPAVSMSDLKTTGQTQGTPTDAAATSPQPDKGAGAKTAKLVNAEHVLEEACVRGHSSMILDVRAAGTVFADGHLRALNVTAKRAPLQRL
ncbi:MAG: hypothetical protein GY772_23975 [bacterium]|nr:hypothetical protein [bacterium]